MSADKFGFETTPDRPPLRPGADIFVLRVSLSTKLYGEYIWRILNIFFLYKIREAGRKQISLNFTIMPGQISSASPHTQLTGINTLTLAYDVI